MGKSKKGFTFNAICNRGRLSNIRSTLYGNLYSSLMSCMIAKFQCESTLKRMLLLIHQKNRTPDLEVFPGAGYTIPRIRKECSISAFHTFLSSFVRQSRDGASCPKPRSLHSIYSTLCCSLLRAHSSLLDHTLALIPTMAPLVIEGNTLGEIHHKYNKLVDDALKKNNVALTEINYDDSDFDNLFKIDIASNNRNVEFILKVLLCTDMLYVSRAIKKSPWLITDKQYAYVINPEYLFNEIRLQMTSKAFNKLILQIRLLLRDEERVEDFFNYYKERDLQTALKWLPHCSQPFIEKVLEEYANNNEITSNLIKRLCEKSIEFLDVYCRYNKQNYIREALLKAMFVMSDDVERYLNKIEAMPDCTPTFSAKYTKIIMTKCRHRIMTNLDKYADYVDVPTFSKFLSEQEIKDFIIKEIEKEKKRDHPSPFMDQKIISLIYKLPSDVRFEFSKSISTLHYPELFPFGKKSFNWCGTFENIHTSYIFAPFETAFTDLRKIIRIESKPDERFSILTVLLTAAGHNMQNIHTLLKYYRKHHINDSFKIKIQFINIVLSKTKTYRYDKKTWNCLKDIFSTMEVYNESAKNVQSCVRSVLLYCVINDETVPEIIDKKFEFESLKRYKNNLSQEEQNKIFNYLLKTICSKIQNDKLQNEKEFEVMLDILENALTLLCDWDKDLKDYPAILERIKHLIEMKKENTAWKMDINRLYNKKKSWKNLLFAESLKVSPAEDTVMNALKHDVKLIKTYKNKIVNLLKDNKNLDIFFKKIRIYFSQSLANSFKELLLDSLRQSYNHKRFITGLCILLHHKEVKEIIKKYAPSETKIDWSEHDEVQLYIRKYLAMNLYLARPQPSLDVVLLYAKGDYIQYALPSLNAVLYNTSTAYLQDNLKTLVNSPVSLQKHGIRAAILKLKHDNLRQILSDVWKSINSIIRADIFVHNHNMLCKEKNEKSIKDKWEILKMFIINLTHDEYKKIYITLVQLEKIPMSVRGEYWMKSYEFLNSLPTKSNCGGLLDHLITNMTNVMPALDDDFVANIFMPPFDKQFSTQDYTNANIVATFLLSAKTEEAQMKRYNKIFVPMFEKSWPVWDKQHEGIYHVRNNIFKIIKYLIVKFDIVVREDMVFPIKMFTEILESLKKKLPETENYTLITIQKLGLKYITIMDNLVRKEKEEDSDLHFHSETKDDLVNILHDYVAREFGEACVEQLKEDIANHFSSIYILFAEALNNIYCLFGNNNDRNKLRVLCIFLYDEEFIEGYLLALEALPDSVHLNDRQKIMKNDILEKIKEHPNKEIKMHYLALRNRKGTAYF